MSKYTQRKIVFAAPLDVRFKEAPVQLAPGPGEIAIRMLYTFVSAGTELTRLQGTHISCTFPSVLGNRAVGEVLEVGEGVTDVAVGDKVFAHANHVSHSCQKFWVKLPANVSLVEAPALGMALVSITALRMARPEYGDVVVVLGAGSVGNLAAQLFQLSGCKVILVDKEAHRLNQAKQCGVDLTVEAGTDDTSERILQLTGSDGADFVIEAAGNSALFDLACSVCRRGGEIIYLGLPRTPFQTDLTDAIARIMLWGQRGSSVTLKGAHEWRYPMKTTPFVKHSMERNAHAILGSMARGDLKIGPLISHVLPPANAADAYLGLLNEKNRYLGVVFDWTL